MTQWGIPKPKGGYTRLDKIYSYNPLPMTYKGTDVEKYMDGVQACVLDRIHIEPDHLEYVLCPSFICFGGDRMDKKPTGYVDFHRRALVNVERLKKEGYRSI